MPLYACDLSAFLESYVDTGIDSGIIFPHGNDGRCVINDAISTANAYLWRDMVSQIHSTTEPGTLGIAVRFSLMDSRSGQFPMFSD